MFIFLAKLKSRSLSSVYAHKRYAYIRTIRPLIVGGLIKKRELAIFPEEINGEGVNKWKWVDFVMQC